MRHGRKLPILQHLIGCERFGLIGVLLCRNAALGLQKSRDGADQQSDQQQNAHAPHKIPLHSASSFPLK